MNAAVTLADFLSRSGPAFQAEAARWHEHAAELGDALEHGADRAHPRSGRRAGRRPGGRRRLVRRAADAFAEAAEQDDDFAPFAMCELAELSLRGNGVAQDSARAVALYERAAGRGHHWAMLTLGDLYERGDGVARDRQRAEHWLQRAVAAGRRQLRALPPRRPAGGGAEEEETVAVDGVRVDQDLFGAGRAARSPR